MKAPLRYSTPVGMGKPTAFEELLPAKADELKATASLPGVVSSCLGLLLTLGPRSDPKQSDSGKFTWDKTVGSPLP